MAMGSLFLSLAFIVALGVIISRLLPNMDDARRYINQLVLYIFLPGLIFHTIMLSKVNLLFVEIPLVAILGASANLIVGFLTFHFLPISNKIKGSMLLAATFGNVTYFGLPVLLSLYPENQIEVSEVSVLYEISKSFLNLTVGSMLAIYYSNGASISFSKILFEAFKLPPIWAVLVAVFWKLMKIPCPEFILNGTEILAVSVSGMMIISLGMALRFKFEPINLLALMIPVGLIKLIFSPFITYYIGPIFGLSGIFRDASVLEASMPSQLLSIIIASKYNLDEKTLAFVIMADTIMSFITIPFVSHLLLGH